MNKVLKFIILNYILVGTHLPKSDQANKSHNQVKYVIWTKQVKTGLLFKV